MRRARDAKRRLVRPQQPRKDVAEHYVKANHGSRAPSERPDRVSRTSDSAEIVDAGTDQNETVQNGISAVIWSLSKMAR